MRCMSISKYIRCDEELADSVKLSAVFIGRRRGGW